MSTRRISTILTLAISAALVLDALAQRLGSQTKESQVMLDWYKCAAGGSCTKTTSRVVVDTNWRWLHSTNGSENCYTGNTFDTKLCPDDKTCTSGCVIDGAEYQGTYGVSATGTSLTMKFVTHGPYSTNIGSRLYLLAPGSGGQAAASTNASASGNSSSSGGNGGSNPQNAVQPASTERYEQFVLLGNEFTFDIDVSKLGCGLNSALYFVSMDPDGGQKRFSGVQAGASGGTGYCDGQCARDLKFIGGTTQSEGWVPSKTDKNAGVGKRGACCAEMDIWEGNSISTAWTLHPCKNSAYHICNDADCGGTYSTDRYGGDCDPDGCDWNSYRYGDATFYGPSKIVDTTKPMTVVTQFIGSGSSLSEVRRFYVQGGKVIANAPSKVEGVKGNSLTPELCTAAKAAFKDKDYFTQRGGFAGSAAAMAAGMTLVLSLWDDHYANLDWLDGIAYPYDKTGAGVARGTCKRELGVPTYVEANSPDASVTFSNIRFGPVGSTVQGLSGGASSASSSGARTTGTGTGTGTGKRGCKSNDTSTSLKRHLWAPLQSSI